MHPREFKRLQGDEREAFLLSLDDEGLEEFRQSQKEHEEEVRARLETLSGAVSSLRHEAVMGKRSCGIEDQWQEDEEYYSGVDDANRSEFKGWGDTKPPGEYVPEGDGGSTIFLNITRPYTDSAAASLSDMLLPSDNSAWGITPTPVPELNEIAKGQFPEEIQNQVMEHVSGNAENPEQIQPEAESKLQELQKAISAEIKKAKGYAERAQTRIADWLAECGYAAENRAVIEDTTKLGSGVLKGPFPKKKRKKAFVGGEFVFSEDIKPISKCISPWNLYPDPGCGDSIHNGAYIFEKDLITKKQLRGLIGTPGYLEHAIIAAIEEGPMEVASEQDGSATLKKRDTKNLFEIWYFVGEIETKDLMAVSDVSGHDYEEDDFDDVVTAQVVIVNDQVIKAVPHHLDDGAFPYDVMVWKKQRNSPWGEGIPREIRTAQRMINGAARNLMDNAGLAGGPMWAVVQGLLEPADGQWTIGPRKGWIAAEDADVDDVRKAFTYFNMDMRTQELISIIQLGLKMAEDVTGMPMILQGQMGDQKIDTLGQTEILNNNASVVRKRIARLYDDLVTVPHIQRYYTYLLQYGEEDYEKGEMVVVARGSSNLVERTIEKEQMQGLMELAKDPVYGMDPKKITRQWARSQKIRPEDYEYDDEEWKQIVQSISQPPPDPRIEVAKIAAQVKEMQFQLENRALDIKQYVAETENVQQDMDRQARVELKEKTFAFESALKEYEAERKRIELEKKHDSEKDLLFDKLRTELNQTVMRLFTQKEISKEQSKPKEVARSEAEPPGKAPNGEGFTK